MVPGGSLGRSAWYAVLLAFIDESYGPDHYYLAAVVCDGKALAAVEKELAAVVEKARKDFGVAASAELHGHELFHGKGDWLPIAGKPRAQIGVYRAAMRAIGLSGAVIFTSGTNPSRLGKDPHALTLEYLIERIDSYAKKKDDYVILMCDDIDQGAVYRQELEHFRRYATGGYRPTQITRVLDTMHFGDSRLSRGLQAADLVAFIWRRFKSQRSSTDPRETKALQDVINELGGYRHNGGCVVEHKFWTPP